MSDRLLKESDVLRLAFQLPLVVNSAFANAVKALPSADRPQGEWIEMYRNGFGNMICICSKCSFHASRSRYCPNCGTRMKGAAPKADRKTEPTISKMEQVEPQTCSFSDCDNFKNPDYERCIECKRKQIKLKTEQTEREGE